jgi:hypothetical protein
MRKRFFGVRSVLIVGFLATAPTLAMAYIDPGNGAYMVQALFTLIGAALFYVRHPVQTAKLLWRKLTGRGTPETLDITSTHTEKAPTGEPVAERDPQA